MPIDFSNIPIGSKWDRPTLAKLWGYKTFNAIARGVITPAKQNVIILYVTIVKQEGSVQYADQLDGKKLFWEGEDKNGSDDRIKNAAANGDRIHLFHRERHHSPFEYMGTMNLVFCENVTGKPSKFEFRLH
ncbi:MAG: hypothetical protein ABIT76_08875 [Chthoniobacterales bacterium]